MIDLKSILEAKAVQTGPTPPPSAPAPAVPQPTLGGALGKAVEASAGINAARDATVAADPVMAKAMGVAGQIDADYAQAMPIVQKNTAAIADLVGQPLPARPSIPNLKPLPPVPTLEEVAKQRGVKTEDFNNPMRAFGQFMPLLVAFGALATQRPGINALNAATAAMNAIKQGDKEAYERSHKEWLENTKLASEENNQLVSQYRMAMEDRNATMAERQAQISALAAQSRDVLAQAALRGGSLDQFLKLLEVRSEAGKQITGLYQMTLEEQLQRDELEHRKKYDGIRAYYMANPPVTSTDERLAKLLGVVEEKGGYAKIDQGERDALDRLIELKKQEAGPSWAQAMAGAGGTPAAATPGAAAPPAAGQNGAQAAAAAAAAPKPAPANPQARTPNTVYMTPRGPMLWTGVDWRPAGGANAGAGAN